jgi:hypothetical protein
MEYRINHWWVPLLMKARHQQFGRLQNIEDLFKQYKVGCFAVYHKYSFPMSLHPQSGWAQEAPRRGR